MFTPLLAEMPLFYCHFMLKIYFWYFLHDFDVNSFLVVQLMHPDPLKNRYF